MLNNLNGATIENKGCAQNSDSCDHRFIFDPEGETVCTVCGIVGGHFTYTNKPKASFEPEADSELEQQPNGHPPTAEEKKEFLISKPTQVDFSCGGFLSTKMDVRNKDFVGKSVNSALFNKLRILNNYVLSSTEMGTFKNAIWMIASFSDRLVLPTFVKERAAEIFKKIYHTRSNIHNSKSVVCGCLYFACKEARINRNLRDIASAAMEYEAYTSDIFRAYQGIVDFFIQVAKEKADEEGRKLQDKDLPDVPKNFRIAEEISYLGSRIGLPERTVRRACEIYNLVRKQKGRNRLFFAGKVPRITGAALLCMAHNGAKEPLDITRLCRVAEVSQTILERRIDSYEPYIDRLQEVEFIENRWKQENENLKQYFI